MSISFQKMSSKIVFSGVHPSLASPNCTHFLCQLVLTFCTFYDIQIIFKISPHCSGDVCIVTGDLKKDFFEYYPINIFEILYINIIVPVKSRIQKSDYFLKPFDKNIWILIGMSVLYFALVLNLVSKVRNENSDFSKNFLTSWNLLISSGTNLRNLSPIKQIIYTFILIFILIIGILFNLYFGNYFIVDLNENDFEIKCVPNFYKLFQNMIVLPNSMKLAETSYKEAYDLGEELNTNFGYCIANTYWEQKLGFQKKFKTNIFRLVLPKWEAGKIFGIILLENFSHTNNFNEFSLKAYSGGLVGKWAGEMWEDNYITKLQNFTASETINLTLEDFQIIFVFCVISLVISLIVFVGEVLYFRIS